MYFIDFSEFFVESILKAACAAPCALPNYVGVISDQIKEIFIFVTDTIFLSVLLIKVLLLYYAVFPMFIFKLRRSI